VQYHTEITDNLIKKEIVSNMIIFQNAVKDLGCAIKSHKDNDGRNPNTAANIRRFCVNLSKVNNFFFFFYFNFFQFFSKK
jgi:hypothetical protein